MHIFSLFCHLSLNFAHGRVFFSCCFSCVKLQACSSSGPGVCPTKPPPPGAAPFRGSHLLLVPEPPVLSLSHPHWLLRGFLGGWWWWFGDKGGRLKLSLGSLWGLAVMLRGSGLGVGEPAASAEPSRQAGFGVPTAGHSHLQVGGKGPCALIPKQTPPNRGSESGRLVGVQPLQE